MSILTSFISKPDLAPGEREKASRYLIQTGSAMLDATFGLADAQWQFKPCCDRWCVAEVLEHVVIVERLIQDTIRRMPEAMPPPAGWNQAQTDEDIPINVPNRARRFAAPAMIYPTGNLSRQQLLSAFAETRSETMELLLSASALRGHVISHPVAGLWDGYQWLLAAGAHRARHTAQILEIKSDLHFPQGSKPSNAIHAADLFAGN